MGFVLYRHRPIATTSHMWLAVAIGSRRWRRGGTVDGVGPPLFAAVPGSWLNDSNVAAGSRYIKAFVARFDVDTRKSKSGGLLPWLAGTAEIGLVALVEVGVAQEVVQFGAGLHSVEKAGLRSLGSQVG